MKGSITNHRTPRVVIVNTHPIQYHAPVARRTDLELTVLYCHRASSQEQAKAGFGVEFEWDVSLYRWEFVPMSLPSPGRIPFGGMNNPELAKKIAREEFDAVVLTLMALRKRLAGHAGLLEKRHPVIGPGVSN